MGVHERNSFYLLAHVNAVVQEGTDLAQYAIVDYHDDMLESVFVDNGDIECAAWFELVMPMSSNLCCIHGKDMVSVVHGHSERVALDIQKELEQS